MPTTSNKEEFVKKARALHGNLYGYDNFEYVNSKTKSLITCPIHGEFSMIPNAHLMGQGCPECGKKKNKGRPKSPVCGVGVNDMPKGYSTHPIVHLWTGVIERCYNPNFHSTRHTYKDCEVCEEWKFASNFFRWVVDASNGYREGYQLDKDILIKGNKIYGPDACCFVPREINCLLVKANASRGDFPIGVSMNLQGKYGASLQKRGKKNKVNLGVYDTPEEAFLAYKTAKEAYIKEVARKYYDEGKITKKVYDALMRYEVEITD